MVDDADFQSLIKNGAMLVDVRSAEEFKGGHAPNFINIPLDSLSHNLSKLINNKPIITVCESGMRSKNAAEILKANGCGEVYNGGSWRNFIK